MSGLPDQHIHPVATGYAAKTVEKHQEQQDLVFYSGWFCPFVQRTWVTLEEKGIPYQYKEVNPYKKEKHFLEINPNGLVPAIEYKGKALYESLILCELLEEEFPNHKPRLLPEDTTERAYARIWIDYIAKSVLPWNFRLIQAQEPDKQKDALDELNKALRTFTEKIKGPYFLGDEFSLVDIAIAPWIVRDYIIAENRGFTREGVSPKWKEYADLVEKRDSILRTQSDKEHYAEIYGRYLRDEAQSWVARAIRAGKPIA
ncbi:glutathione-S-transferase [Cytidiella melzeri]|nr:glutathione-S-transferase [Cytidiella melzeri]